MYLPPGIFVDSVLAPSGFPFPPVLYPALQLFFAIFIGKGGSEGRNHFNRPDETD